MFASAASDIVRRYALVRPIGQGGMGIVYEALDRLTGREVALKRVWAEVDTFGLGDSNEVYDFRMALAREFKLSASLRHPNIVQVLDYGFDLDRQPYYTMELLKNTRNLFEAGRGLPLEKQVALIVQTLYALSYLHRRGIVHRDLKPANVLVVDGQVKVLDFGLSFMHERLHEAQGAMAGTLAYMAPEVLMGQHSGILADLYAVGIMAYEMIAGSHPFATDNPSLLVRQVVSQPIDVTVLDVPADLALVIHRLVHKDPQERYTSAAETVSAISEALDYRVPTESAAIRESFLQAANLVGREDELKLLSDSLAQVSARRGMAWLVAGESGVGKSRVLDELRTRAMVMGAIVMRGNAVRVGGRPFEVWLPIVRWIALLNDRWTDDALSLFKLFIPDLGDLLGLDLSHVAPAELVLDRVRERMLELILGIIRQQRNPVLILLEDIHWAGTESLSVLKLLSERIHDLPLMIVASYRDDERPQLHEQFQHMPMLKLRRLDESAIVELSAAMLGEGGRNAQVVDLLQRETEGNVFFIIEVVRALAEEVGRLDQIGRMTLPPRVFAGGMKTVIQRRLSLLDDESAALLRLAAIMGRQLDPLLLRALSPETDLNLWLSRCVNAAVLEVEDDQWRFTHDKLRDALLDNMTTSERQGLHQRIALALEELYGNSPARLSALAYHWGMANNPDREEHYVTLAGEQALRIGAYREALNDLGRALQLLDVLPISSDRRKRKTIHLKQRLAMAHAGIGQYAEARALLVDSLLLCEELGDEIGVAVSLGHLGDVALTTEDLGEAHTFYQRSLEIYSAHGNIDGMIRAYNQMGNVYYEMDDDESARRYFQEAMSLSRRSELSMIVGGVGQQADTHDEQDSAYEQARAQLEQTLTAQQIQQDERSTADTLCALAAMAQDVNHVEDAVQYYRKAMTFYRKLGDDWAVSQVYGRLGELYLHSERLDEAWSSYQQALRIALQIVTPQQELMALFLQIAHLFAQRQQMLRAVNLLSFIVNSPQSSEALIDEAEKLIFKVQSALPAQEAEQAWEDGKSLSLPVLMRQILEG
ncbi:MAG: tetratricopeptide repeat protein [Anaerolineae bacterium]|nr:tetratricopeptide repeat protein [Anaerolineae bacterium]MDW8173579.1 tetratricopeptide repeat protein [Anaerolineae bacterium]